MLLQFDRRLQRRQRLDLGLIAGVDEAGRGPLAGPVVAGAVILHRFNFSIPIDDSKVLTHAVRVRAYRAILRSATVGVGAAGEEEIDRIGIHAATHMAMLRALARLPVAPELVVVDGRFVPSGCPYPALAVVKGDARSLSVACASIVAKVVRDRWMRLIHRLHPEYGFYRHKGYGTEDHVQRIREFGPCAFHRYSFRPFRPEPIEQLTESLVDYQ
ncbi:MAG: ribonuclease HII [Candidatus Omnitrophica bacterium]|nr:ribonuclease HII [Candidatus Omnitrophota bacterium]